MSLSLSEEIGRKLKSLGWTVATAESCTGGLAGSRITDIPGSSAYFPGGVVAYANDAKRTLLGVREETLSAHGAVSAEAALEMAAGVRALLGADIGLAVTGIAGPGGAVEGKPVGTVWLALSADGASRTRMLSLHGDRAQNKSDSADGLLRLLDEYLAPLFPSG